MIWGILLTSVATVLHLAARQADVAALPGVLKMAASAGFLITAAAAGARHSAYGRVLFSGLVLSAFGDFFLIFSGAAYFLAGLISFFLAHVGYCLAYMVHRPKPRLAGMALAALIIPAAAVGAWIWDGVEPAMRVPVVSYIAVISIMVALAFGLIRRPGGILILIGAALFYISDIFVARGRFVEADIFNSLIGLPLYFGGQLVLAASIRYAKLSV